MHRLRWLSLVIFTVFGGCTCGTRPGGGGYDGSIPDYSLPDLPTTLPPDAVEVEPGETWFTDCAELVVPQEALVTAATDRYTALDDGTIEMPLAYASDGTHACLRFVRVMSGGHLQSADIIAFTGESTYAYTATAFTFGAYFATLAHWERGADGTLTGTFDADDAIDHGDTFREVQTIEHDDGYYQMTRFSSSTHEPIYRLTIDGAVGARVQTTEELVAGTLAVVDRTTLDDGNLAGGPTIDSCLSMRHSCDPATVASLEASMRRALSRGSSCMFGASTPDATSAWDGFEMLKNAWTKGHTFACMPPSCTFAHWCEGCGPGGENQIDVGEGLTTKYVAREDRTLFHELNHGVLGGHLDTVVNSEIDSPADRQHSLMRKYADPVDSCESLCFDSAPTRCACATCFNTTTCDPRCDSLASCVEFDCTSGSGGCVAIMSEAVGTACVTTASDGSESATWFPTKADCAMSGCGNCRSSSRSCEPGCE